MEGSHANEPAETMLGMILGAEVIVGLGGSENPWQAYSCSWCECFFQSPENRITKQNLQYEI